MGKDPLHTLLSNPENRQRLITNIAKELTQSGYDGVNIDFELISASDRDNLTLFMKELKSRIGPDKMLSIALFARTANDKWATPYNYKALGAIADKVVVMAYDYHYATDSPGPVAPLWWVKDVVAYTSTVIAPEKLLLGMPTYGYDWAEGMDGTTVTAPKLDAVRTRYSTTEKFDLTSMSPGFTYIDDRQVVHQIWMENERSLTEKWKVATENGLGGISFWRIGTGFDDLYRVLENNLK
jgi:spore germination protein YaaH